MKVLYWVSLFPTVSETFIRNQITDVLDKGIEVAVLTKSISNDLQALEGFESYNLLNVTTSYKEIIPETKFKKISKAAKILLGSFFRLTAFHYIRLLQLIFLNRKKININSIFILHFLLQNKITVVHCHFGTNGNEAVFVKKIGLPIKLLCTFHGYDIRLGLGSKTPIYNDLFKNADTILAISNYNREKLLLLGALENKIIDLNNGVKVSASIRTVTNESNLLKILSVGRLVEDKGYQVALNAVAKLIAFNSDINIQYDIIGGGKLENELIKLSKTLNIDSIVTFHGSQNSEFVKNKMLACDFLFLPSKNEALPTVVLEAQSLAIPVLATNVGSIKDIVIDDETGFLVNYNEDDLKTGLEKMIANRANWSFYGKNAKNNISKNYNRTLITEKLLKIYTT